MDIKKIGGGKPVDIPEKISSAGATADKKGIEATEFEKKFEAFGKDHLEEISVDGRMEQVLVELRSGHISVEEAKGRIVLAFRKQLESGSLSAEEVDSTIEFIKEIIDDDPTFDSLLKGR